MSDIRVWITLNGHQYELTRWKAAIVKEALIAIAAVIIPMSIMWQTIRGVIKDATRTP